MTPQQRSLRDTRSRGPTKDSLRFPRTGPSRLTWCRPPGAACLHPMNSSHSCRKGARSPTGDSLSSSTREFVAERFARVVDPVELPVLLTVEDRNGVDVSQLSASSHEAELLCFWSSQFEVVSLESGPKWRDQNSFEAEGPVTPTAFDSPQAIGDWRQGHVRVDFGLTAPCKRSWYAGGCEPTQALASWRTDRVQQLGAELYGVGYPLRPTPGGIIIEFPEQHGTLAASRTLSREGPPNAYGIFLGSEDKPAYVVNAPEVVTAWVKAFAEPVPPLPDSDLVQIGVPGHSSTSDLTYVGCWRWDIHSEARSPEFVRRAANAIVDAIKEKGA